MLSYILSRCTSEEQRLWEMTNVFTSQSSEASHELSQVGRKVCVTVATFQTGQIDWCYLRWWQNQEKEQGLTNDRMLAQGSVKDQGTEPEHLLVGGGADIDAPRVASGFEFACQSDVISKQAISWHSYPNNSSQHRAWMNAYPHLKKKKKDILCFHLVCNYFNEKYC